jgi:hypothetical protein
MRFMCAFWLVIESYFCTNLIFLIFQFNVMILRIPGCFVGY